MLPRMNHFHRRGEKKMGMHAPNPEDNFGVPGFLSWSGPNLSIEWPATQPQAPFLYLYSALGTKLTRPPLRSMQGNKYLLPFFGFLCNCLGCHLPPKC